MIIKKEMVKMFVIHFNHPFKKIIGEIIQESIGRILLEPIDTIKIKFPVLCEEVYSGDGKSGTAYLSSIPSVDDTLLFNRSQILILPFKPTDEYINMYMDMVDQLNYPISRKVTRSFQLG